MTKKEQAAAETRKTRRIRAAAPQMLREMKRYLVIIERCEDMGEFWDFITSGTGIATANGHRAAIKAAEGEEAE